jgi:hypothetical protein
MNLLVANIVLRCFRPRTSGRRMFATQRTIYSPLRRWYAVRTAQRAIPTLRSFQVQEFKARTGVRRIPSPLRGDGSKSICTRITYGTSGVTTRKYFSGEAGVSPVGTWIILTSGSATIFVSRFQGVATGFVCHCTV